MHSVGAVGAESAAGCTDRTRAVSRRTGSTVRTVGTCDGCVFDGRASGVRVVAASDVQGRVVIVLERAVCAVLCGIVQCHAVSCSVVRYRAVSCSV